MKNSILALVVILTVSASSLAWCDSKAFQIGATIPFSASIHSAQQASQPDQRAQIQQIVRNNQVISMVSYVTA